MAEKAKVPAIRFKGFTDTWEQRKLGECFDERQERSTGGELISVTINDGIRHFSELGRHDNSSEDKSHYKRVEVGDIAYNSMRMWQGASGYSRYSGILSPAYTVVIPQNDVDSLFFSYVFKKPQMIHTFQICSQGITSDTWNLKYPAFSEIETTLPKLEEQKQIAAYFRNLDDLITLHQRKYEKLQNVKKSCLEKMFPKTGSNVPEIRFKGFTAAWEQRKLGDITDSYSGGTPSVGVKDYYGGDIPFIRSAEINSSSTELFITQEGLANSSARIANMGDILYALYGATSGEVGCARLKGAVNQAILVIQPYLEYCPEFIMQWLRKSKQTIVDTYLQGGQGNLSGAIVKSLIIDCPSTEEQTIIGAFFRNLDNLITLHQRELKKLQNLKKACLEKMFPACRPPVGRTGTGRV